MPIQAINTVSFQGKSEKKASKKEKRDEYFAYLSKYEANEALKMSKGREVKDGKFRLADMATSLGAIVAGVVSLVNYSKVGNIIEKTALQV